MNKRYLVRPKADQDLEEQSYYYAVRESLKPGHRFLLAAHETFALLAAQPLMGWSPRLKHPALERLRLFRVSGFANMLILYRPASEGIEILRVVHGSRSLEALWRAEDIE